MGNSQVFREIKNTYRYKIIGGRQNKYRASIFVCEIFFFVCEVFLYFMIEFEWRGG